MKKISVIFCVQLWLILLFVSTGAQDFKTIYDGIEYAEVTRGSKDEPVRINLLKLDLTKVRLDVVHAMDAAIGLEKTSSMATRHDAFAAINAGFFRLDNSIFAGDAAGILMIDGKLLSESNAGRIALNIANEKNQTIVGFYKDNVVQGLKIEKMDWDASGINRERKKDELIIYTREFNRTTLTDSEGLEIIVQDGKIIWIADGKGSNLIPERGFVISASGKFRQELLGKVKIGQSASAVTRTYPFGFGTGQKTEKYVSRTIEDMVGGVPQLIKDGKIEITWEQEKSSKAFVETRHPRTAVAKFKDGKFLMVTVDGRQPNVSVGMNLNELAAFLLELGAVDAMNLDGGGSTTMFLGSKVVNKPSDKEGERRVSDAILVFPRKK